MKTSYPINLDQMHKSFSSSKWSKYLIGTLLTIRSQCYKIVSSRNMLLRENTMFHVTKHKPVNKWEPQVSAILKLTTVSKAITSIEVYHNLKQIFKTTKQSKNHSNEQNLFERYCNCQTLLSSLKYAYTLWIDLPHFQFRLNSII